MPVTGRKLEPHVRTHRASLGRQALESRYRDLLLLSCLSPVEPVFSQWSLFEKQE